MLLMGRYFLGIGGTGLDETRSLVMILAFIPSFGKCANRRLYSRARMCNLLEEGMSLTNDRRLEMKGRCRTMGVNANENV